jgi:hypothetical protein
MATFQYGGLVEQVATTATAGTTTTLTNVSKQIQIFTGSLGQTIVLPNATTYNEVGAKFEIYNESSGNLTLQFNGGAAFTDAAGVAYGTLLPHTSLIVKVQTIGTSAGTWAVFSGASSSAQGVKNYLSTIVTSNGAGAPNTGNGNFETGTTTGWSLTHSTLDANNKLPNQASGSWTAASANLSIAIVSSGQLAGDYSLNYANSTGADVAGDMVISSAFFIDKTDEGKALGYSFEFQAISGASFANWSGTISNSFAVAFYDVTNAVWIQPSNFYGVIQQSGSTVVSGTFQTSSNGTSYRMAFFNMNATSAGAFSIYLDDFFVGPTIGASSGYVNPTISKVLGTSGNTGGFPATSSSGTYTTPTNPVPAYIRVRMVGGGGGGSNSGTATGTTNGGAGGASTFGTLSAGGGSGGVWDSGYGGSGGTSSLGSGPIGTALPGTSGQGYFENVISGSTFMAGGQGGSGFFGGGGSGQADGAGQNGQTNTGGGGAGGGTGSAADALSGAGGGSGGYVEAIISNPASSYSYSLGAAGAASTGPTTGFVGGAGGSGYIEVTEYYAS